MTLVPVRRFSFAGEQQDSDTATKIVRRLIIRFPVLLRYPAKQREEHELRAECHGWVTASLVQAGSSAECSALLFFLALTWQFGASLPMIRTSTPDPSRLKSLPSA